MAKTLVLGASPKSSRYANQAVQALKENGHEVIAVGKARGDIDGTPIQTELPEDTDIHTVTLYLNSSRQKNYEEAILKLAPERIIFNPGEENREFKKKAEEKGIETLERCTLVMLSLGHY